MHYIPKGTLIYRRTSVHPDGFLWEAFLTTKTVIYDFVREPRTILPGKRNDVHLRTPANQYYLYDLPPEAEPYVQIAVDSNFVLAVDSKVKNNI